jgi:hypothetical protein
LLASTGIAARTNNYNLIGILLQYRWGAGLWPLASPESAWSAATFARTSILCSLTRSRWVYETSGGL